MITKRSISKPNSKRGVWRNRDKQKETFFQFLLLASTIQFSNHHAPHVPPNIQRTSRLLRMGNRPRHNETTVGWRSGSPKAYPYHSRTSRRVIQAHDLFHTSIPMRDRGTIPRARGTHRLPTRKPEILRRKEVIQPHLPVRLPCYDLVPITSLTLDGSPQKGWATGFGCYPLS